MKKFFLIFAAALAANVINAQLKVDSLGFTKVSKGIAIGTNVCDDHIGLNISYNKQEATSYYGINSYAKNAATNPSNDVYAIYAYATNATGSTLNSVSNKRTIGVLGGCSQNMTHLSSFGAGIAGVGGNGNAIGIYGLSSLNGIGALPTTSRGGRFAGYFQGNVSVTGTLTANTITETSDERLKDNISALPKDISEGLFDLKPISFKYTKDSLYYWYEDDAEPMTHTHYGLVAQEVKEVFPDLVYEDGNGYLSVNYIEIIPLLINTIKQQEERIAELEKSALPQAQRANAAAQNTNVQDNVSEAVLLQNTPNPFSEATVIGYSLPDDVADAAIYVYDMQGTQLQKHELTQRGSGTLTISGGKLRAGMYLYSLIADGNLIDTKRMILTE